MEMAELGKICQRNIFNSQLKRKLIPYSYIKKRYAPYYKNKFRKICIANSGADMSCTHDTLFRKYFQGKYGSLTNGQCHRKYLDGTRNSS